MNDESLPPSNIDAERYVLAAMMWSNQAIAECTEIVGVGDFLRPVHRNVFRAMVMMFAAEEPVTPVTLLAWMQRDGDKVDPVYLADLYGIPASAVMAQAHARLVWEASVRRNVEIAGVQLAQMAGNMSESPADLLNEAQKRLTAVLRGAVGEDTRALSIRDFLALDSRATQPVIPGLLDHQERVIVVGSEGSGKSTLAFQVGFALAAGVHPFASEPIPPGKALIVDLENPVEILKRRVRGLYAIAGRYPGWDERNVAFWSHPGGLDITRPGQAYRLAEVIRREQPDLLVCGPLYKMLPGGEVAEYHHATLCRFFDVMRERYDCAIWLETHAPMQTNSSGDRAMRPLGSGVYSRWPEFGISLAKRGRDTLELQRFRGDREEGRAWPDRLTRSGTGWPWAAVYPPGTFSARAVGA